MNKRTRIRTTGAYTIPAAESRPRPITPRDRTEPAPTITDHDRALTRAVRAAHAARRNQHPTTQDSDTNP